MTWVIRKEIMELFDAEARRQFETEAKLQLQQRFPQALKAIDEFGGEPVLQKLFSKGVEDAATYQIEGEANVLRYLELMLGFHLRFVQQPNMQWAVTILEDETLPEGGKIGLIDQYLQQSKMELEDRNALPELQDYLAAPRLNELNVNPETKP